MLQDDPESTEPAFVYYAFYGKAIHVGLERFPRDIDEPHLKALIGDTTCALRPKKTRAGYGEYLHIGCYAFSDNSTNTAISEGMDSLLAGPTLSPEQAAAAALIKAGHLTHTATQEAARTRLGILRLTKGGYASTDTDHIFAHLTHERFCRPRRSSVSGTVESRLNARSQPTYRQQSCC
jgi:hypothetical protein